MKKHIDIFLQFLGLGLVSFGGPAAHLGYFQKHFVEKKQWLDNQEYANLVALSQFLPGPASSQVGFAIGLKRGGTLGAILAFLGFTLPSFLLMFGLVFTQIENSHNPYIMSLISSLKLLAVVVITDAIWSMAKSFCKSLFTIIIPLAVAAILFFFPSAMNQLLCLGIVAAIGLVFWKPLTQKNHKDAVSTAQSKKQTLRPNWLLIAIFLVLLLVVPLVIPYTSLYELAFFNQFYQSGALVFGGGHVVLPLLQEHLSNPTVAITSMASIDQNQFLLGYSAAQAIPGPMFTFATYLGGELLPANPLLGATLATIGIFLPGFLLIAAFQNSWQSLSEQPRLKAMVGLLNAAVIGLLLSALIKPIISDSVHGLADLTVVILGFIALKKLKLPILWLIFSFIIISFIRAYFVI